MSQTLTQPDTAINEPITRYLPDRFKTYRLDGLSDHAKAFLGQLFDMGKRQPRALSHNQLSWLGSLHPLAMGDHAEEIHNWMCQKPRCLRALIGLPFDEDLY